jgi:hypothetical protein
MLRNEMSNFIEDLPRMLPTKFRFIWPSGYRGEDVLEINQSETRIVNLVESIIGRSSIKTAHLVPIR